MSEIKLADREIILLTASGLTVKEIASKMKYTSSTVESYRNRLMKRIGVKNAPELVSWAYINKIL